jgi:hypothetical protein
MESMLRIKCKTLEENMVGSEATQLMTSFAILSKILNISISSFDNIFLTEGIKLYNLGTP